MKRTQKSLVLVALSAATVLIARAALNVAQDVQHYNRIRKMSNQGPIWEEVPEMLRQIREGEKGVPRMIVSIVKGFPKDLDRYLRMRAM
jgi:hypothetical protein